MESMTTVCVIRIRQIISLPNNAPPLEKEMEAMYFKQFERIFQNIFGSKVYEYTSGCIM